MNGLQNTKITKRQYWQDKIKEWEISHLSQSAFCAQSGIKQSTFSYWRSVLLEPENKNNNKFSQVKIVKEVMINEARKPIEIRLLTGHVVYVPSEIGMNEIAKLIHLLGLPYA
jgi:hypothetical protein